MKEKIITIEESDPMALTLELRLCSLLEKVRWIDSGGYKFNYHAECKEPDAVVPIFPEKYKGTRYKGLRYGLLFGIQATRLELIEMGRGAIVEQILAEDNETQNS